MQRRLPALPAPPDSWGGSLSRHIWLKKEIYSFMASVFLFLERVTHLHHGGSAADLGGARRD